MKSVKITEKLVEVARYEWPCPDCGEPMFQMFHAPDNREMLCRSCSDRQWNESKEKWVRQSKKSLYWLINATITDVAPDAEYWHEVKPDSADIVSLRIEKDGQAWDVFTANDVPHLYIHQIEVD